MNKKKCRLKYGILLLVVFWCSSEFSHPIIIFFIGQHGVLLYYTNCLYMYITIIYYCQISKLRFVKTTLLHTPSYLYLLHVIFYFFNTLIFTAKHLIIVIISQNMFEMFVWILSHVTSAIIIFVSIHSKVIKLGQN